MVGSKPRRLAIIVVALAIAILGSACDMYSFMPGTKRPSWCDPTDTAVNDGHTSAFFASYSSPKGPLSQADCLQNVNYIKIATDFASQYPTVAAATAAGWKQATVYTPGQGAHYVDLSRQEGPFDPM